MDYSFDTHLLEKNINSILDLPYIELVPDSKCTVDDISKYNKNILTATDYIYFLIKYGAVRDSHDSFSTLSIKGSESIDSMISELKAYYDVPDNLIPFYYVGSDCLCIDLSCEYGMPGCIKGWSHEAPKPTYLEGGIYLFLEDSEIQYQIMSFFDFINVVAMKKEFPGVC